MVVQQRRSKGKVLTDISHGEHLPEQAVPGLLGLLPGEEVTFETPFRYLFSAIRDDPDAHLPANDPAAVVQALNALGAAMVEPAGPPDPAGNSTIPAIYTYWGQFVDHDLTANTDRNSVISDIRRPDLAPLSPDDVEQNLKNLRQPSLNLDSVYGDGPTFPGDADTDAKDLYVGPKLKVGTVALTPTNPADPAIPGDRIPPDDDLERDLPRQQKKALIADARNDENLIVAQLHTAFLRFHNKAVDWVQAHEADEYTTDRDLFMRARQLTRWHYQWLTIHDYLRTLTMPGIVDKILLGGPKHYVPNDENPYMPLEFSVAAFRFGHTMVRGGYDHNRNFGSPGTVLPFASLDLLFLFTGGAGSPFGGVTDVLPFNWIIEWDRFVDKGSPSAGRFARKIDTVLTPPLATMVNQGNDEPQIPIKELLKQLARRNLLRSYLLSIPTGQAVASAMGVMELTADQLQQGNSAALNQALVDGGFLTRTPLWYYVLKEAEVQGNGNFLGEVGSRILCETMIGQLLSDPESYLRQEGGWHPGMGVRLSNASSDPVVTLRDFLHFAGLPA